MRMRMIGMCMSKVRESKEYMHLDLGFGLVCQSAQRAVTAPIQLNGPYYIL